MPELASVVKGPASLIDSPPRDDHVRFAWAAAVLGTSISPDLAATIAVIGSEEAAEASEKCAARGSWQTHRDR